MQAPDKPLKLSGESSGHPLSAPVQILFVDRSDTVRARVAAGLLERVAEWNGYGRALYPSACGVEAAQVWRLLLLLALLRLPLHRPLIVPYLKM